MPNRFVTAVTLLLALATAATANAETVTGTFTYLDGDGTPTPIRQATVEVWRRRARDLGIWSWGMDMTAFTDDQGKLRVDLPFVQNGVDYSLRVYATNPAVQVFQKDFYVQPFFAKPGTTEIIRTTNSAANVHDFSFNYTDQFSRDHFNAADAALRGFEYASARRDPRETDDIARVSILMTSAITYYDPIVHAVRLNSGFAMDDFTVLHEYAHYLEERISSFKGIPSTHNGCDALVGAVHVEEPGHAWMEGFADYFAQAVGFAAGANVDGPAAGTLAGANIESRGCTNKSGNHIALEQPVAATLFDLIDGPSEKFDTMCMSGSVSGSSIDRMIFQIFDRELDIGWTNPNLQNFVDAWIARGLDFPPLLAITTANGISLGPRMPVVHYDRTPAANFAVWRPGPAATWWVNGGQSGSTPVWGVAGDIPVPGDYDGDGLTDIAIWRPSDGNWWVALSATGVTQITQWGTAGDVPLPADYDGDKETDFAVYRPSDGTFYFYSDNCGAHRAVKQGNGKGTPVVGDFDNDGSADFGLWDSQVGFLIRYANGTGTSSPLVADAAPALTGPIDVGRLRESVGGFKRIAQQPTVPVIGDYDGDKRADFAIWTPSTGIWKVQASTRGAFSQQWGIAGDVPVPADYDGDGITDFAIWRPSTGEWWTLTGKGQLPTVLWGQNGDVPVPAR